MMNSVIVDIPTDWLYRGKRRQAKAKAGKQDVDGGLASEVAIEGAGAAAPAGSLGEGERLPLRSRSASISNAALSKPAVKKPSPAQRSSSTNGAEQLQTATQLEAEAPSRQQQVQPQQQQQKMRRSSSVSFSDLKKGDALNERSKKSLFGSLFGKKSTPSPPLSRSQPQSQQQHQHQQQQHHAQNGASHTHHPVSSSIITHSITNSVMKEPVSPEVRPQTPILHPACLELHKPSATIPFGELAKIRLKRVTFAVDKFDCDPPQQLPSRKPKMGNVLVPEDMISDVPPISLGITNGNPSPQQQQQQQQQAHLEQQLQATAAAAAASSSTPVSQREPRYTKDSKEYKIALDDYRRALKESVKHQQEAHFAAKRIESEVASFKASSSLGRINSPKWSQQVENDTTATVVDDKVASLSIDKPIHMHENHFNEYTKESSNMDAKNESETTLDVVYTRCCHLREILPIPSTLRQVKGKTAPLHTLKFLNPKPTLIDILSFCDFISVVPINIVIFDKVSLTPEMFQIVLMSLVNSTVLEKLSVRNVPINQGGWRLLCKFLLENKSLVRLDISQTKKRQDLPEILHRDNMDWSLFSQVLTKRTGKPLEELLMNGIKFQNLPIEQLEILLESFGKANSKSPLRLGVATSDINTDCIKCIFNWMSKYKVQGVDLAFNDLSELVKVMVSKLSALELKNLEYFTLNSTNISSAYDLALLLKYLSLLPALKFLDISNLPQTFPDVLPYMFKYLPRFPKLNRINLDNNNLSFKNMSMLCNILGKCNNLTHISIQSQTTVFDAIGPNNDMIKTPEDLEQFKRFSRNTFSASLYALVKDSPNLVILDVDYDNITDDIKSRIALMLMRNMNKNIDSNFQIDELSTQDELIFDGSLVTETAEEVLKRINNKEILNTDPTKRYLTKKYCEKLQKLHLKVQYKIDDMFEKRSSGELPLQEKENLLRLLLLEKNLTNILEIYANIPHLSQILGPSSTQLPSLKHVSSEQALSTPVSAEHEIAARPHLMATDSGRVIDVITGKSLLVDSPSNVSRVGSRRQEEEEGELHKWGFFVQQQRSIYPEHESRRPERVQHNESASSGSERSNNTAKSDKLAQPILLPKIPSGTELREAIIQAKGIDSIDDLIKNVNKEQVELESIYGSSLRSTGSMTEHSLETRASSNICSVGTDSESGSECLHSTSKDHEEATVKETYDKLLNNLKMERPIKPEGPPKLK